MQRIRFANQLRGLAALAVACSHLIGVFWAMPDVVAAVTSSPPQGGALPGLFWLVAHPWVNFGPLGVAIFFLISGLVIPFSLEKHSRTTFIIARLLRIYPTYLAALLLELAVLYVAARAWGRPFAFSPSVILSNALLIYDLTGLPSIDLVNWTLSVELKFYLLAVLLAPAIRRGRVVPLIATAVLLCAGNGLIAAGLVGHADAPPSTLSYTFSSHSVCLIFMLMGVAFNLHIRALIDGKRLILTLAVLLCLFLGSWRLSVWSDQYPVVTVNYIYAFVIFLALYIIRDYVPRNPILDGLAAISFPFYLIHSLIGYSILKVLMIHAGLTYYASLTITVASVVVLASIIHFLIELPTIRIGRWASQLSKRRPESLKLYSN